MCVGMWHLKSPWYAEHCLLSTLHTPPLTTCGVVGLRCQDQSHPCSPFFQFKDYDRAFEMYTTLRSNGFQGKIGFCSVTVDTSCVLVLGMYVFV